MSEGSKKAGFVESLFKGLIRTDMLKPFPTYGREDRKVMSAMLDTIRSFATEQIDPVEIDREHHIPESVRKGMKEIGLWGLIIPEEYGGCQQPDILYNKTMEIINGVCGSTAVLYGGHLSIGLKAILLFGTDEQKQRFLPELAAGDKLAAFALTEPEAGSDASNVKTTAELSEDGKHYILNGSKQWITNGGLADVFTLLAKVQQPGEDLSSSKLTAFIVTRDMEGFSSGKEEDKLGLCGASTTPLYLDNVQVPVENVLGEVGNGFKIFMEVLNTGRLSLSAGCVGTAKAIIPHGLQFALEREQFNSKISEFEMIKEKFARILINTFTSESIVYFTTWMKEVLQAPIAIESAICKVFTTEALWETINDCLQVAGGNGFMKDYPYERFLRDARINTIFEGTNEIQRMFIALSGTRPLSQELQQYQKDLSEDREVREKQITKMVEEIVPTGKREMTHDVSERLRDQTEVSRKLAHQLNEVAARTILRHGPRLRDMEFVQKRLADAAIDLFGIFANIARVENLIRNEHPSTDNAILISRMFSLQARRRIHQNLNDVEENQDDVLSQLAEMLYRSKKYPFEILDY